MHRHINSSQMVMHYKGQQSTNGRFTQRNSFHHHIPNVSNQRFNHPYTGHSDPYSIMGFDTHVPRSPGFDHSGRGRCPGRAWRGRTVPLESQSTGNMRFPMDADTYVGSPNYTMKSDPWNNKNPIGSSRGLTSGADSTSSCDSSCSATPSKYQLSSSQGQPTYPKGTKVVMGSSKSKDAEQHYVSDTGSPYYALPRIDYHWQKMHDKPEHEQYRYREKSPTVHQRKLLSQRLLCKPVPRQFQRISHQPTSEHSSNMSAFRHNGYKWPVNCGNVMPQSVITPDRFLTSRTYKEVTHPPEGLCTGDEWDKLSEGIWNKFMSQQQKETTFCHKIQLWQRLSVMIKSMYPQYSLFLVGSTMTGFGCNNSDVDMCVLVRQTLMDQRAEAVAHLEQIMHFLQSCDFILDPTMIQAKVPILKFRDQEQGFEIDLNCNNSVGIRNTHLLYCYEQMDWRVRPLVLVVKLWAHAQNINDAKNMTISSYSLTLMVIHFLQCGASPPVLPCLHSMYSEKFLPHVDVATIDIHEQLKKQFSSTNKQSLGELLYLFLFYYTKFDYSLNAISVRLGDKVTIEVCRNALQIRNEPQQWKYLCIEEPFDFSNTARSVYDHDVFEFVKKVFSSSLASLQETRCVESIFRVTSG